MKLNQAGIDLIKQFEGCKLTVYPDVGGLPTVGYGHMDRKLNIGDKITQDQADKYLASDLGACAKALQKLITVDLTDNQFSAIVAFAYNVGIGAFDRSTMHKLLNAGGINSVSCEFEKWDKVNGVEVQGLKNRRLAEKKLFLS